MREEKVDLGIFVKLLVPDEMSEKELLDFVYRALQGEGHHLCDINMRTDLAFEASYRLEKNLENLGSGIKIGSSSGHCCKLHGDTRTPRQRAKDFERQESLRKN
jgi:hypothetical protein